MPRYCWSMTSPEPSSASSSCDDVSLFESDSLNASCLFDRRRGFRSTAEVLSTFWRSPRKPAGAAAEWTAFNWSTSALSWCSSHLRLKYVQPQSRKSDANKAHKIDNRTNFHRARVLVLPRSSTVVLHTILPRDANSRRLTRKQRTWGMRMGRMHGRAASIHNIVWRTCRTAAVEPVVLFRVVPVAQCPHTTQ